MGNLKSTITKGAVALTLAIATVGGIASTATAASTWKTAAKTENYYSWTGIHVGSLGVKGDYYTNGTKILVFDPVRAYPENYVPFQSYSDVTKAWTQKTSYSGWALAEATFKSGIKTQWIEINVQRWTDSVKAYAYR